MSVFRKAKRIVIKIGSSTITSKSGNLDLNQLENLVEDISKLKNKGFDIVLVSSGAIAAGVERLGLSVRPTLIPELQAAASVGQGLLIEQYANLFKKYNLNVGQVLLTQADTTHRQQYLNARNTIDKLLEFGVIPIINENDTTAIDEIRFGDNDTLAALVASLANADLLIVLTDIDGLYTGNPRTDKEAKLIDQVDEITEEIEALAGGIGSNLAVGGMVTKIEAAKVATFSGIGMVIANGKKENVLEEIMSSKPVGTFFVPRKKEVAGRKRWIAFGRISKGKIIVDDGAKNALCLKGKSLLAAGVIRSEGNFIADDAVDIADMNGCVFARGLTNYSASELGQIKGLKTSEISSVLSDDFEQEVIHRDCLVILKQI
ncbi:MAG: glutamate 5-kinase [Actinobacteria bacterium]|nr:glutamate 5-kinase [Actinomycetota bacterium]